MKNHPAQADIIQFPQRSESLLARQFCMFRIGRAKFQIGLNVLLDEEATPKKTYYNKENRKYGTDTL